MPKPKRTDPPSFCLYWTMGGYFNHGGVIPCETCPRCIAARESLERLKRWNEETERGADPRR